MKTLIVSTGFVCMILVAINPLHSQNLEDMLSKYTEGENGRGYMQPLADVFGANINTGLYHGAVIPEEGFHISGSLEVMMAPIGDDARTFTASTEDPFYPPQEVEAPTVFGDPQGPSVEGTGGTVYNFPGGFDVNWFPSLVPQITVGTVLGTQGVFRYIDFQAGDNIGRIKIFGFGLRHSVSQWIEKAYPFDLAAVFFRQSFDVEDVVEANSTFFGLVGSYSTGILSLYGGPGFESANLDIAYETTTETDSTTISFDLDGANSARFTIGAALDLRFLGLHVDYNIASQSTVGVGISFGM